MIKAILFDVGGTLITPKPDVGTIYAEVAMDHGVKISPVETNQTFKKVFKEKSRKGETIDEAWWRELVEEVLNRHQFRDFDRFFRELYKEFAREERWKVFDDVFPALETYKKDGFILGIASNWDERLPALLDDLGLAPYFTYQFISIHMNCQKPQPQFYTRCIQKLSLKPEEIFLVGDNKENDLEGPKKAGMKAALLDRNNEAAAWPKVKVFSQLKIG